MSLAAGRAEEQARLAETIAALTNEVVAQGTARLTELAAERFEMVTTLARAERGAQRRALPAARWIRSASSSTATRAR